ncbi:MAG: extracellular solute-binding protein [Anaerovoracaceae bacterium]
MKKSLKLILLSLVILTFFGCTSDKETEDKSLLDPDNPQTVVIWHYYSDNSKKLFENMISEFNETVGFEKGVYVEAVSKGRIKDLEDAVTNSAKGVINSDPMPNIFSSYIDKAVEIDELGQLVNLDDYLTKEQKSKFFNSFLKAGYNKDRFLAVPIVKSTEVFYINKNAWDEYKKVSNFTDEDLKTWEGIFEISKNYHEYKLLSSSGTGLNMNAFSGLDDLSNFIIIGMRQQGVEVIDAEDKKAVLDKASMRKVFDIYFEAMTKGYFYESGKFRTDNIKSQDIISYIGSTSGASYFPTWVDDNGNRRDIDLLVLPYPNFKGKSSYYIQQGAGMSVVEASPKEIEASILFLDWFTDYEQNMKFAMSTGYLPVNKKIYNSDSLEKVLKEMENKEKSDKNIAAVYRVAMNQLLDADSGAYASKPFIGSYQVRSILADTLRSSVDENMKNPDSKIDSNKAFEDWINNIKIELEKKNVLYEEV